MYPFGYGLSYTTFEYSNLTVGQTVYNHSDPITITVDVQNIGKLAGDEVVQLYVKDVVSSVITYDSQLRGFERIHLLPGEKKTITFILKPEELQLLDKDYKWIVEPGEFKVMVGSSSKDIRLVSGFSIF